VQKQEYYQWVLKGVKQLLDKMEQTSTSRRDTADYEESEKMAIRDGKQALSKDPLIRIRNGGAMHGGFS